VPHHREAKEEASSAVRVRIASSEEELQASITEEGHDIK